MRATAFRSILAAVIIGTLLILLKHVIVDGLILAYWIRVEDGEVREAARMYIFARLWGAPFALGNYAVGGFLNGMAKVQLVLQLQILLNSLNCLLCVGFAFGLGLGVEGIGWAAALANLVAFLAGVRAVWSTVEEFRSVCGEQATPLLQESDRGRESFRTMIEQVLNRHRLMDMLLISSTLTVRSLCLTLTITSFTALTASLNEPLLLAGNLLLLQLHDLISTGTDGFSNAAETLVGEAIGARNRKQQ